MRKSHRLVEGFSLEWKWLALLLGISLLTLSLLFATLAPGRPRVPSDLDPTAGGRRSPRPPRLAYMISGSRGDGLRLRRALQALYHPWNFYLLHLDLATPPEERTDLAAYARSQPAFVEFGNVRVVEKADAVSYKGPTMIACTLHAVAILLREFGEWSWFINLSAADYPLMPQDGIF